VHLANHKARLEAVRIVVRVRTPLRLIRANRLANERSLGGDSLPHDPGSVDADGAAYLKDLLVLVEQRKSHAFRISERQQLLADGVE
jgi:hypothetical protein